MEAQIIDKAPEEEVVVEPETDHYDSLFDEGVSDDELRGGEAPSEPEKAEDKATPPEKAPDSSRELEQIRAEREASKQEIDELKREVQELKASRDKEITDDDDDEPDFKVLSDEEYEELLEEDPVEAIRYERKLKRYEAERREKESSERQEVSAIQASVRYIEESVPGIYDQNSGVAGSLAEFYESNGLSGKYLGPLTDPETRLILKDPDDPKKTFTVPLAFGAAALTEFIYKTQKAITQSGGGSKKGGGKVSIDTGKTLTEDEFGKLSPEEQEKWLGAPLV